MIDHVMAGGRRIGIILLPGFPLMAYASAVEPLRAANLLAGRNLYDLRHYSPDGSTVVASSGAEIRCLPLPLRNDGLGTLFVCAGGNPADWDFPAVRSSLRALARKGVRIGGISGGPYVMAAAGLLDGYSFTIHWEHLSAFRETFPDLVPESKRFALDRGRITCGGGVAPLDMMHALISEDFGKEFAGKVSDWFLHTDISAPAAPQRGSPAERHGVYHDGLLKMIAKMESAIELPLSRQAMADFAGISSRQLNRLFAEQMGTTYLAAYLRIRLAEANRLLKQSSLSISEIGFATGFSSASHFSRAYREAFNSSPSGLRRRKP